MVKFKDILKEGKIKEVDKKFKIKNKIIKIGSVLKIGYTQVKILKIYEMKSLHNENYVYEIKFDNNTDMPFYVLKDRILNGDIKIVKE